MFINNLYWFDKKFEKSKIKWKNVIFCIGTKQVNENN
jgi:hypothetical protein